jgi:Flp pilus assembly protein TadB
VFAELGERLEVSELTELAASVSLAGTHGARIRASLAAKADALRGHQQAEVEAEAEAATERMTIPVAVLLFGFLVFIAYPALIQITSITQTR